MTLGEMALVGTARAKEEATTGTAIDAMLTPLDRACAEWRLLLSAGALEIFRRAGRIPHEIAQRMTPAAPDEQPVCSAGAAQVVRDMFDSHHQLLPEAFGLLARAHLRLPSSLLVESLDFADPVLREAVRPILGERGRWLAMHRDLWGWARLDAPNVTLDALHRVWEEGRLDERLIAIRRVRDRDAGVAREWIGATWAREKADVRLELLDVMDHNLAAEDEPWLNAALKDRAAAVRARAAAVLARLPGSAFAVRAETRAADYVSWIPPRDGGLWSRVKATVSSEAQGGNLRVTPPETLDPTWEADGLSVRPPHGVGERAHWLTQAVALVDPQYWVQLFGVAPADLVRAAGTSDWSTALMLGWSRAAARHGTSDWIATLWDWWLTVETGEDPVLPNIRQEMLSMLFLHLRQEDAERRMATVVRDPKTAVAVDVETAIRRFNTPWSEALGRTVLEAVESALATDSTLTSMAPHLADLLRAAGPAIPASLFDRGVALAVPEATRVTPSLWRELEVFAERVRLRQRLHEEIAHEL